MNESLNGICFKLRFLLEESVKRNSSEGILLSGGLDTSVLAVVTSKFVSPKAFTVGFEGAPVPDIEYATLVAYKLRLKHIVYYFNEDELYYAIQKVVETVKSFDPMEIRNSAAIYVGLKVAKEHGISTVITGDGCDELFAGYSFLFNLGKEMLELEL